MRSRAGHGQHAAALGRRPARGRPTRHRGSRSRRAMARRFTEIQRAMLAAVATAPPTHGSLQRRVLCGLVAVALQFLLWLRKLLLRSRPRPSWSEEPAYATGAGVGRKRGSFAVTERRCWARAASCASGSGPVAEGTPESVASEEEASSNPSETQF